MAEGKTYWLALDARWLQREGIVEVRDEVGHAGVVALLALMQQAKLENDGGRVKTGYRTLAKEAFLEGMDEARAIVAVCAAAGVVDELIDHDDGKRFTCRLSGWTEDQFKGRAAQRKAEQRANTGETHTGQSVTERDKAGHSHAAVGRAQHSTEEPQTFDPSSVTAEVEVEEQLAVVASASNDEVCALFAYWQISCSHPQAKLTDERRRKITGRLRDGYTADQIRLAIDGAATNAHVNDDGVKFDDLELICRNGSKLELFMKRATARPSSPLDQVRANDLEIKRRERALEAGR